MKKAIAALVFTCIATASTAPATAAVVVSFSPASQHIGVLETTNVALNISGLDAEILRAIDVRLLFNPAVLENYSVAHNDVIQFGGVQNANWGAIFNSDNTPVNDSSKLSDAELIALPQANDFTLLTFSFRGLADGYSLLQLGTDLLTERHFVGLGGQALQVEVVGPACISVGTGACPAAVPEPGTLALLGLGLAGLAATRRRKQ